MAGIVNSNMRFVREGVNLLREGGIIEFLRGVGRFVRWRFYYLRLWIRSIIASLQGESTLYADEISAQFSAKNTDSVVGVLKRHQDEYEQLENSS
jgi:DNA-binding transcriptional regulator YhcF (GntR family)